MPEMMTERVPVKMTPGQKAVLTRLADAQGETLAATIRSLVREEAARRGLAGGTSSAISVLETTRQEPCA